MSQNGEDLSLQELLTQCLGKKNYLGVYVASKLGLMLAMKKIVKFFARGWKY